MEKKASHNILIFSFGSPMPLSGIFIRTRQFIRALQTLNQSVAILEFRYGQLDKRTSSDDFPMRNLSHYGINCVSQSPAKRTVSSPIRQMVFQVESLRIVRFTQLLRASRIVVLTSSMQILPALLSRFVGAKIVLDMNDVNSRVAQRIPNTITRTLRYIFWRPLESFACRIATVILVNKEDEGKFLTRYLNVHPRKILVVKTCLEERQDQSDLYTISEIDKLNLANRRVVLFLANMTAFMNQRAAEYILNSLAPSFTNSDEFKDVVFVLTGIGSDGFQPTTTNVVTTGTLSEVALSALVDRADICIDPAIISGGIKTKIQYYLRKGKVIVTTQAGAEGINLYGRRNLAFIISGIEDFETALKRALRNIKRLKNLGTNNRDLYFQQFSWDAFLTQMTTLVQIIENSSTDVVSKGFSCCKCLDSSR